MRGQWGTNTSSARGSVIKSKVSNRSYLRQFQLKTEVEKGIGPLIEDLLGAGVIRDCPNLPLFPVGKAPPLNGWRIV